MTPIRTAAATRYDAQFLIWHRQTLLRVYGNTFLNPFDFLVQELFWL